MSSRGHTAIMGTTDRFDSEQYLEYRKWGIRLQEEMFGKTFTHVGGEESLRKICNRFKQIKWKEGQKVRAAHVYSNEH